MSVATWIQNAVLWVHIGAGLIALVSGPIAVAMRKGSAVHARAGLWFVGSMLVLGLTATILARLSDELDIGVGGILTCYFVLTSWVTARRRDGTAGRFELAAFAFALGVAATVAWAGATGAATTPVGPTPLFVLATMCMLAGIGDLLAVLRKKLTPAQRLSRHLWRMCLAFFIATGSLFIGQQDTMPEAVRGSPVMFILGFAPLAVMAFWLVRLRFAKSVRRLKLHVATADPPTAAA